MKLTERKVQLGFQEGRSGDRMVVPNFTPRDWFECDLAIVTAAGFLHEYEIKLTKADLKADRKKFWPTRIRSRSDRENQRSKFDILETAEAATDGKKETGIPSAFSYILPEDIVTVEDIPEYAGLIYVTYDSRYGVMFKRIRQAKKLHNLPFTEKEVVRARVNIGHRYWAALRELERLKERKKDDES